MLISAAAQAQEVRGVWSSRFQWPSENEATAKSNITGILDNMNTGHFNCLFFQVRGQCDVYYPSPYEPWAQGITSPDNVDPGWDPLEYAVTEAHSRDIELHVYFNTHTIWGSESGPPLPAYSNHVYYTHGNPDDPDNQDWLLFDDTGVPSARHEYWWLNPGIPDADAHVRREAVYIVTNYDVDGLHFDRARMPQPGYGKNPIAVARWDDPNTATPNDGPGNPEQLGWDDFMRDCVTRALINICGQSWGIKPTVVMSSAPLGLWKHSEYSHLTGYPTGFQYGYDRGQDAVAWMQAGAQDFIVPQIYWANGGSKPDFNEVMDVWHSAANAAGRYLVPASRNSNTQAEMESNCLYARSQGTAGFNLWHSGDTNFSTWSQPGKPYESAAPALPTFPWRSTEGVITGHAWLDPGATQAAVDVHITRNGSTWTALSSGDGFFCFLKVPPGTYTITATHDSFGTITVPNVVVTAGLATDIEIAPPSTPPAAPSNLSATAGATSVDLTWDDNSTNESGFEVWRGSAPGGPYSLIITTEANVATYTDSPGAGTWYYVVRSTNDYGDSAYSNEDSATLSLPAAPTGLTATLTTGLTSVTLTWTDNADNETTYQLYRGTAPGGPFTLLATLAADSESYVDDAVLYATDTSWSGSFYYHVRAQNALGNAPDSNQEQAELTWVPDMILESRDWSGNAPLGYAEGLPGGGSWNSTVAKSLVTNPGLRSPRARFSGTGSLGSYAEFTPNIFIRGTYEVTVTGPNAVIAPNAGSPGTLVEVRDGATVLDSRTYDNSRTNTDLADKWMSFTPTPLIAEFLIGDDRSIRLTNTNINTNSTGQRFNVDAIRLRFVTYTPVAVSEWSVE